MSWKQTIAVLILGAVLIGGIVFYFGGGMRQMKGFLGKISSDGMYFEMSTQGNKIGFRLDEGTKLVIKGEEGDEENRTLKDFELTHVPVSVRYGKPVSAPEGDFKATEWYRATKITVTTDERHEPVEKPVIYLYPERETVVRVQLNYDGQLTTTYPKYEDGWRVVARPDGTLSDGKQEYRYLYWEGVSENDFDFSKGFCVPGKDSAEFLEKALASLALNRAEANEFIVYWLPRLEANPYNLLAFQKEAYTDRATLDIIPKPDTMIRVFLAWKPLEEPVDIEPQIWETPIRRGFTVVEWGGTEVAPK